MSERLETKRCIKALYKYSSFPFLSFKLTSLTKHMYQSQGRESMGHETQHPKDLTECCVSRQVQVVYCFM